MDQIKAPPPVISDVNQLLENLLLKELPIRKNGIEISFEQPTREWSSRLNGPTLNLFLYDLRKNKLRQGQWETQRNGKGRAVQQRPSLKFDLHYMVTAWVFDRDPSEEHYLLTATLLALSRHPRLPDADVTPLSKDTLPENSRIDKSFLPPSLQNQPGPIPLLVAEPEELLNPSDIWSAVDNELRPSIACTLSIALDPFQPIELDMVSGREFRVGRVDGPVNKQRIDEDTADLWPRPNREVYQLKGTLQSDEPLEEIKLILVGRGIKGNNLEVPFSSLDDFTHEFFLHELTVGYYKLEILAKNQPSTPYDIIIPIEEGEFEERKGGIMLMLKVEESHNQG